MVSADKGCSIPDCPGTHEARGWCAFHYERWRKYGDPLRERPPAGSPELWRVNIPRYTTVHSRLRDYRGSASNYQCMNCDEQAAEWSCIGNKNFSDLSGGKPVEYSIDIDDYVAMCHPCNVACGTARGEEHPNSRLTEEQARYLQERAAAENGQLPWDQLAHDLGVHPTTIRLAAQGETWSHLPTAPAARAALETHRRNRRERYEFRARSLTPDQIREIRTLRADGWKLQVLADRYGVSITSIWRAVQERQDKIN